MVRTTDRFKLSSPKPWQNTAESVKSDLLPSLEGAHPCHDCLAPCCWQVIVARSQLVTGADLEQLGSLLEYLDVSLWVGADGAYSVALLSRCHHFDVENCGCALYGSPERPGICESYDASCCWYRKVLGTENRKQISRANWKAFREKILVSEEGDLILSIPTKDEMIGIQSKAVSTGEEEPVRLAFPITEAVIGHTTLDDYLLFLGNFEQVSLMRNDAGWLMLFKTMRRGNQKASDWEYTGDNESGEQAVQIDRKALDLLRKHADFPAWPVSQLRSFLGRDMGA